LRKAFEYGTISSTGLNHDEIESNEMDGEMMKYAQLVERLSNILSYGIEPTIQHIQALVETMTDELETHPELAKKNPIPDILSHALSEAKAADDIYGSKSIKASDAWNKVEQIAMDINISGYSPLGCTTTDTTASDQHLRYKESALRSHHEHATVLDVQSLDDAMSALMKLEHLTRLVAVEKCRLASYFDVNGEIPKEMP